MLSFFLKISIRAVILMIFGNVNPFLPGEGYDQGPPLGLTLSAGYAFNNL